MINDIDKATDKELEELLRCASFVGTAPRRLLLQSRPNLIIMSTYPVLKELARQRIIKNLANHRSCRIDSPVKVSAKIAGASVMLLDYFGIDNVDGCIVGIPEILSAPPPPPPGGYQLFANELDEVDFADPSACISGVADAIASLLASDPSASSIMQAEIGGITKELCPPEWFRDRLLVGVLDMSALMYV